MTFTGCLNVYCSPRLSVTEIERITLPCTDVLIYVVPGKRADFSVHADRVKEKGKKKAGREFHTAFHLGLLRFSGHATTITAVDVINEGFAVSSHVAISSKVTFCLRYVTGK